MIDHALPAMDPEKGGWDDRSLSRRQLFQAGFITVTGATTLLLGGIGTRFLVGESLQTRANQWVELGALSQFPSGSVHRVVYELRTRDLWRNVNLGGVIYVFTEDGESYSALDATCTHLGCNVRWQEAANRFSCPCHEGHFTREGEVISGPPPKPLNRLETKIENGSLFALI